MRRANCVTMSVAVAARLHRGAVPAAAMSSRSHSPFRHPVLGRISTPYVGSEASRISSHLPPANGNPRVPRSRKVKKGKEIPRSPRSAPGPVPPNRRGRDDRSPVISRSTTSMVPSGSRVACVWHFGFSGTDQPFACACISWVPFVTSDPKGLCIHGSGKVSEESRNETAWPAEDDDHAQGGARAGP